MITTGKFQFDDAPIYKDGVEIGILSRDMTVATTYYKSAVEGYMVRLDNGGDFYAQVLKRNGAHYDKLQSPAAAKKAAIQFVKENT